MTKRNIKCLTIKNHFMKKLFTNLKVFMTLLLLCGVCSAWGEETSTYTFNSKAWGSSVNQGGISCTWKGSGDGNQYSTSATPKGVQVLANQTGLTITSSISFTNVKSVSITYSSSSKAEGTIGVQIGTNTALTNQSVANSQTGKVLTFTPSTTQSGVIVATFNVSKNSYGIESISVTYEPSSNPTLSVSPTTIDFGTVYQNAEVDDKAVTVSFANLTTNDVVAAISGSVFGINKTTSFTTGDNITITPNTATIGEYSETLTVTGNTDNLSKEVTVTMNVVEAPAMEKYNKVTDVNDLNDGDVIVLVSGETAYGVAPTSGHVYIDAAAFDKNQNASLSNNVLYALDAYELTLAKSGDNWTMTGAGGIVGTTAAKTMTFGSTASGNVTTWSISIDGSANASITSTNSDYGTIKYNSTSPRFLNYASGLTAIQIYKKELPPHTEAFTVTFDAGDNGSCATSSLTEDEPDAGVVLPACTANEGYEFVGWSKDDSRTSANAGVAGATYYPQGDCTLYACYAQVYKVTIEEPSDGSLVVKVGDATVTSGEYFIAGTVLNIEATPADGYKFRNWQAVDATTHTYDKSFSYTMGESDVTIKANFDKKSQYTIDYMVNGVSTGKQVDLYEDEYLVFPEVSDVGDYVFGGWKKEAGIDGTVASFADFAETENVMPTESTTYYAVFYKTSEKSVTFDPNTASTSVSNLTWTIDGVSLKLSAGQLYTTGTPKTFTVTKGTSNNFQVSTTNNECIKSLDVTVSGTSYKIDKVDNATLSTNGTTQTVTANNNNVTNIKCYATSSNQIRVTNLVANVSCNSDYCTTISQNVTISPCGMSTAYLDFDAEVDPSSDAKLYYATLNDDGASVTLVETASVPANTGFIVKAEAGSNVTFGVASETPEANVDNVLVPGNALTFDGVHAHYALSYDNNYVPGFYMPAAAESLTAEFTPSAGKAYIEISASADVKSLSIDFGGDITGVESVQGLTPALSEGERIYNLNGQVVGKDYKGIVIVNGKKMLNK